MTALAESQCRSAPSAILSINAMAESLVGISRYPMIEALVH